MTDPGPVVGPITVDIRPEVNILSVLRHLNYKTWFALGEFVDNALGSYLNSGETPTEPLQVSIDMDLSGGGRILITDNAFGIRAGDFPRAFRAADTPPDQSGLSEFGMGMKSAASWFARQWSVRTSVPGEPVQRRIAFNLDSIVEHQTHTLAVQESPAAPDRHFTVVELTELNHFPQGGAIPRIRQHLASIYRQFLRRGVMQLTLNGSPIEFREVEVLEAPPAWESASPAVIWQKEISIDLLEGRSAQGFVALRAKGSTSEAGLALFRRDRLILGSFDEAYRPVEIFKKSNSFIYQRLFGELELSGFDVSHTKDGFRWDNHEERFLEVLLGEISAGPVNLIRQAEDYRVKLPEPDERKPITDAVGGVAGAIGAGLPAVVDSNPVESTPDEPIPDFLAGDVPGVDAIKREVRIATDDGVWVVELSATIDDVVSDWLEVGAQFDAVGEGGQLETHLDVTVSFAHPFTRRYIGADGENSELLLALASGLGIALALGKRAGARSQFVLTYLNSTLRTSFENLVSQNDRR